MKKIIFLISVFAFLALSTITGCSKEKNADKNQSGVDSTLLPVVCFSISDDTLEYGANDISVDAGCTVNGNTYLWSFGDGSSATGSSATHIYSEFGIYDLKLTVTNAKGSNSKTVKIFVKPTYPSELIGTYQCNEFCASGGQYNYTIKVLSDGTTTGMLIENFGNFTNPITIKVNYNNGIYTIPLQSFPAENLVIKGGSLSIYSSTAFNYTYTANNINNPVPQDDACSAMANRQ